METRLDKDHSNEAIAKILRESYESIHFAFEANVPNFDYSGTTCCSVVLNGHRITTANVGDSRAILINNKRQVTQLTQDNKPDQKEEKARITAKGGRVEALKLGDGSTGPARVWIKDRQVPGLAMSRSIGDYVAHSVGVTHEPIIEHFRVSPEDQICIIASDGVFEFMSNQNVANIAMAHYETGAAEAAANAIVRRATHLWRDR